MIKYFVLTLAIYHFLSVDSKEKLHKRGRWIYFLFRFTLVFHATVYNCRKLQLFHKEATETIS